MFTRAGVELALCERCLFDGQQLVVHSMSASARRPHLRPCACKRCTDWDGARRGAAPAFAPDMATRWGNIGDELRLDEKLRRDDAEGQGREDDAGDDEHGDGGGLHSANLTPLKA